MKNLNNNKLREQQFQNKLLRIENEELRKEIHAYGIFIIIENLAILASVIIKSIL